MAAGVQTISRIVREVQPRSLELRRGISADTFTKFAARLLKVGLCPKHSYATKIGTQIDQQQLLVMFPRGCVQAAETKCKQTIKYNGDKPPEPLPGA
eukprot:scaffold53293_cov64-Phaeocystis_antarctica.AAC.1